MPSIADLRKRYEELGQPVEAGDDRSRIESALGLRLPDDIGEISEFYSGGMLGGISHFSWEAAGGYSVVEKTKAAQTALSLAPSFIFLADPPESAIVWRADTTPRVVWCHAHDFERVAKGEAPTMDIDAFESYADFFSFLLDREKEESEEDQAHG